MPSDMEKHYINTLHYYYYYYYYYYVLRREGESASCFFVCFQTVGDAVPVVVFLEIVSVLSIEIT